MGWKLNRFNQSGLSDFRNRRNGMRPMGETDENDPPIKEASDKSALGRELQATLC
jgi:hypothetical protein